MSKLEEMWAALTAYQPQADADGHGATWATMCRERTVDAALDAAFDAATAAAATAAAAAYAVHADDAAAADWWAQKAIKQIKGKA